VGDYLFYIWGYKTGGCGKNFWSLAYKPRNLVLTGMAAFCWASWISRNDLVFQKSQYKFILHVIFRGTIWIRSWSVLSKEEERIILMKVVGRWSQWLWRSFMSLGGML
jgi:hypothetical protein